MVQRNSIPIVSIDPSLNVGQIKIMNAVNNGPAMPKATQTVTNFDAYRHARIPYARLHDSNWAPAYGAPHTVDITAIFPDFDADVNSPDSYDFVMTDNYLEVIEAAGTEVFFRLGQSIEHGAKKYGIYPPKDFQKWAEICEHIIRHYTEGWNNGYTMKITYWEIWNEPDLDVPIDGVNVAAFPKTWGGTTTQFFELFRVAICHLKKCFPHLKIGGPACAGNRDWGELFFAYMQKNQVPMDFFSWHRYCAEPEELADLCKTWREMMDKYGYEKSESILNEWNYVLGWRNSWVYSLNVESGADNLKGAAFVAAAFSLCQNAPVDMLMYYDARVRCGMNGLFDITSLEPRPGYYPFYAWAKLRDLGTQVKTSLDWNDANWHDRKYGDPNAKDLPDITAAAAISSNKKSGGLLITRYTDDNNVVWKRLVRIRLENARFSKVTCHLTDPVRVYTEIPLDIEPDGSVVLEMYPTSFAYLEW